MSRSPRPRRCPAKTLPPQPAPAADVGDATPGTSSGADMILAVDPSIGNCGWAVAHGPAGRPIVAASGVWRPSRAKGSAPPCEQLAEHVAGLVRRHGVAEAAIEVPDGGERLFTNGSGRRVRASGQSERTYAQAVGACRAAARVAGARVWPVRVSTWKGTAPKSIALAVARGLLGRDPVDTNEADAVGLAAWWLAWAGGGGGAGAGRPGTTPDARRAAWREQRFRELLADGRTGRAPTGAGLGAARPGVTVHPTPVDYDWRPVVQQVIDGKMQARDAVAKMNAEIRARVK